MAAVDADASRRDVDARLAALDHPLADAIEEIRAAVRAACPDAVESWKWNAPSSAREDHFATLALRKPDEVLLVLHAGARARPDAAGLRVPDPSGLLRVVGPARAVAAFRSADEVRGSRAALEALVREWAALLAGPGDPGPERTTHRPDPPPGS